MPFSHALHTRAPAAEKRDAGQAEQTVPAALEALPARQDRQSERLVEPATLSVPAGQNLQDVLPALGAYVAGGQLTQAEAVAAKVPGRQGLHQLAPEADTEPAPHWRHEEDPTLLENVPAAQEEQDVAPVWLEKDPRGQGPQEPEPALAANNPAAQGRHASTDVAPEPLVVVPAGQSRHVGAANESEKLPELHKVHPWLPAAEKDPSGH